MRARSVRTGAVAALLAAAALTACGGGQDNADDTAAPGDGKTKSSPAPATSSPPAKPSPSFTAADGDDLDACKDADCEVTVSEPVTIRFKGPAGPTTLSVTEVARNKVEYTVKSDNGRSSGGATGPGQGCLTVLRSTGSGNTCGGVSPDTAPSPQPDAVVIQMTTGPTSTALLQIVSK
ncbi:hypothetical protein DY218_11075 [Streptomyces triticagri]|uniref:Uncharacterized protein n=1 Tax=Streptomyces triticagri TaxID=2293568 RepID=A0A372M6V1_9ACTN|nr:hypothetical protein [Streptomyces triticagri]RFU86672.1 hypothetical protein DY218_11075 [Streptomyces triticagri]